MQQHHPAEEEASEQSVATKSQEFNSAHNFARNYKFCTNTFICLSKSFNYLIKESSGYSWPTFTRNIQMNEALSSATLRTFVNCDNYQQSIYN